MSIKCCVALLPLPFASIVVAQSTDDPMILTLATRQESFLDWYDPARQKHKIDESRTVTLIGDNTQTTFGCGYPCRK